MSFLQTDIPAFPVLLRYAALRILRSRRRLAFSTIMAFLSGYLFYAHWQLQVHGMPVPVFTGLLYGGAILVAGVAVCVVLPRIRFMVETVAVSRLLVSIAAFLSPGFGTKVTGSPELSAALVIGGAAVISKLVYGSWSSKSLHLTSEQLQDRLRATEYEAAPDLAAILLADRSANLHARPQARPVADTASERLLAWVDDSLGRSADRITQIEPDMQPHTLRPATAARRAV